MDPESNDDKCRAISRVVQGVEDMEINSPKVCASESKFEEFAIECMKFKYGELTLPAPKP